LKLILSRKGFDASAGGGPSPILPDGRLAPLPSPDRRSRVRYADARVAGEPLGGLVAALARGRVSPEAGAHLDPDLDRGAFPRPRGWRPVFGQEGAAQAHLAARGVGPGDVFLFFGWFRKTERTAAGLRFCRGTADLHVIFGWLRVAQVIPLGKRGAGAPAFARQHPHLCGKRGPGNTLYVGRPGEGGLFPRFHPRLRLTAPGVLRRRSLWRLPAWAHPAGRRSALSHHDDPARWQRTWDGVRLASAPRGQEFVLDLDDYPEAQAWLASRLALAAARPQARRRGPTRRGAVQHLHPIDIV
jgi:hypothetical protein